MTSKLPKPPTKVEFCLELILEKLNGLQEKVEKIQGLFEEIVEEKTFSEKETSEDLSGEETEDDPENI